MNSTDSIWADLCDMRFKGYLLAFLVTKYQKWDRKINIFLALASSASIGTWAVWDEFPLVWGGIVAASQVVSTIKPYFPYSKMIRELNEKCHKLDLINIEYERTWGKIRRGKLTEDEIEQIRYDQSQICAGILAFSDDLLVETPAEIIAKANHKMKIYLKSNYDIILSIN
ncbi:hypothetical protein SAMN05518672_11572 [Chitinophaga sp. CF118]|uniref:hypothetical protein n=1 Tax=Chitinophaga sp. CF118 TaxID=1884367 RepID=UPI0008E1FF48|nr:hypothetical protein [Chitinophaga sp. CF118]SFF07324.1 hypothetical protein SAMN05518672_11572 [Chitinophaga sp. CF118]